MKIYVDADACPKVIKEILFRAAEKRKLMTFFVANQAMMLPRSKYIKLIQVSAGFDVADNKIVEMLDAGDLVITADIPLAGQVIEKRAHALNPRGEEYTPENIKEKLATRNLMQELRGAGLITGGPGTLVKKDQKCFADALDRLLSSLAR